MAGTTTTPPPSTLFLSLFSHSQTQCKAPQHPCFKSNIEKRALILCSAKKKLSFTDQILDYIEGIMYSGSCTMILVLCCVFFFFIGTKHPMTQLIF